MSGGSLKLIDEETFSFLKARMIAFPSVSFIPTTVLDNHFGVRELGKGRLGRVGLGRKERKGRRLFWAIDSWFSTLLYIKIT